MDKISLRQLRYFDAVAQYLHFGDAAIACAVSQPALSMQIKQLEEEIGQPLFERHARQVRLTEFGEEFRRECKHVLDASSHLGEWVSDKRAEQGLRLRLGIIPTVAPYLLPRLIRDIHSQMGDVQLQLRETMTSNLLHDVKEGKLDAAILALPVDDANLEAIEILQEEFVLIRPQSEANLGIPERDQLKELRWLLLEEGHCFRDQALAVCDLERGEPREVLDGSSLSTLVQMVGAGMGVTLLPQMAVHLECQKSPVCVLRFDDPPPKRCIGMIWRKGSAKRDVLTRIAGLVRL